MRQIIRDSVKRMTVPKCRPALQDNTQVRLRHSAVISQTRRTHLDSTQMRHSVTTDLREDTGAVRQSAKSHTAHQPDNRYSMNLDSGRLTLPDPDLQAQRSRTFGDLVDLRDGDVLNIRNASKNSVSSDTSHGSGAVLVYSSQDPIAYSSKGSLTYYGGGEPGSPVWEKRSDSLITESMTHSQYKADSARNSKIHEIYMNTATEC